MSIRTYAHPKCNNPGHAEAKSDGVEYEEMASPVIPPEQRHVRGGEEDEYRDEYGRYGYIYAFVWPTTVTCCPWKVWRPRRLVVSESSSVSRSFVHSFIQKMGPGGKELKRVKSYRNMSLLSRHISLNP